ncbi:MAG: Protein phosphatase 2C 2 [Sclerophora amabilis]|nr:MAG: Protein phosphatase 2C 2 [Sclerophora amabilis]
MGQTLSEPVVDKTSSDGGDERLIYGVSAMQGWRISMEDAHAAVLDLQIDDEEGKIKAASGDDRLSFFGVYDGHGGDKVAIFAGEHIHKIIAKQDSFKEGNLEQALKDGFLATDRAILNDPRYEEEVSGCTASVGIISKSKIFVGNAGDSRTVLGVKGRAKPLSFDHKPQNEGEKARINAAGGFVDFGRVNGNLALSRAIGDFEFKKSAELSPEQQIVTAYPDVIMHEISDDDEFLVIACDGIWDCQSSQAVIEFVRRGIAAKQELFRICENMMDNCLSSNSETGGVGCDNMTMTIIGFLRGKTKDEWYEEVASRVAKGDGPCAPPEYGKFSEFRGPGVHHNFDESADDFESDFDQRLRDPTRPSGQIILLGDGTEVLTDSNDAEIFDHDDEDKDLESQVNRAQGKTAGEDAPAGEEARRHRESTPGPSPAIDTTSETQQLPEIAENTAIPEKLVSPATSTGRSESEGSSDKPPESSLEPTTDDK